MTLILASRPNAYTGSPLDRATHRRDDAAWIAAALADPQTLLAPVWRSRNLMRGVDDGAAGGGLSSAARRPRRCGMAGGPWAFLGLLTARRCSPWT